MPQIEPRFSQRGINGASTNPCLTQLKHSRQNPKPSRAENQHLSICTNRTCKKQGSQQIAKFVEDLQLEGLTVEQVGCLAKCGNGPNMALSPLNVTLSHVNTIAKMREILTTVAGLEVPDALVKASELRAAGNSEARSGNLQQAAKLYTQALDLNPPHGRHLLLSNRSGVFLSLGKSTDAARDADEAAALAPPGFRNAFIRQIEAHCALKDLPAAAVALEKLTEGDPSFSRSREYKEFYNQIARIQQ